MRPVLLHVRGRPVHSFVVMLYLAIVLGTYAGLAAARPADRGEVLVVTTVLVVVGLLGTRLLYVLPRARTIGRREVLRLRDGGASLYGGLVVVPLSVPLLAAAGLRFGAYWDAATFSVLVGAVVGRLGCVLNGCCAGRPTGSRWGVLAADRSGALVRRVPTQLLEAGWGVVVLLGALALRGRLPVEGALLAYALIAYSAGRVLLDPWRDRHEVVAGRSLQRMIAIVTISTTSLVIGVASLVA